MACIGVLSFLLPVAALDLAGCANDDDEEEDADLCSANRRLAYCARSNRRHRAIISPGITTSPRPSMAYSAGLPEEEGLGARSLMGASRDLATVTMTGVAKTCFVSVQ